MENKSKNIGRLNPCYFIDLFDFGKRFRLILEIREKFFVQFNYGANCRDGFGAFTTQAYIFTEAQDNKSLD